MQYRNYRVKSPIRSFRDLEVYQKTIELSDEITNLPFLNKKQFEKDIKNQRFLRSLRNSKEFLIDNQETKEIAQKIPKLIAESYGDKFDSRELAHKKLTDSITLITDAITKIDLFRQRFAEDQSAKETLDKLLTRYQTQKVKVLHLRRAWGRVFTNKTQSTGYKTNYQQKS